MRQAAAILGFALGALVSACGGDADGPGTAKEDAVLMIESPAFRMNGAIPEKHTGDGEDLSPPLTFELVPEGAVELALICDDPDAPTPKPWVHWVVYRIPPDSGGLPEGFSSGAGSGGPLEGANSWRGGTGYRGPKPPSGTHRYFFKLYALDAPTGLSPGATKEELLAAMEGHVLTEAALVGTYAAK